MSLMKMDVDHVEYNNTRQHSSQEILEDSSSSYFGDRVSQEMRRRIAAQVLKTRSIRNPNDPIVCDLLVPPDMAKSTFALPAVEKLLRQFLPLEEAVLDLLRPQVDWAPPGYKPGDRWTAKPDESFSIFEAKVLRELVVECMTNRPSEKVLFQMWRKGQLRADAAAVGNASFEMEEDQVVAEWNMLVQAAKTRTAYLSAFHTFVLANVLRRPIVVYGDRFVRGKDGEPYAPSDVRGVYLPTLLSARQCYEVPLVVGYTCVAVGKVGHFTALVGIEGELLHLPLVDEHGDDLPVRYGSSSSNETRDDTGGELMDTYMRTTTYTTREGERYRMALVGGAHSTREAQEIREEMADAAERAFERLAKAQEEEIKRQLSAAPKGTNPSPAGPGIVTSAAPAAAGVEEPPPGVAMAAGTGIATHTADGGGSGDSVVSRSISPVTDGSDGPTADSFLKRTVFPPAASEEKRNLSPARSQSKATCSAKQFSGGGAVLSGTSGTDEKGRRESDNCANHRPHRAASRSNEHRGHSRGVHDSCRPGTSPGDPDFSDQRAARTLLLSSKHVDAADYDNLRDRGDDDVAAGLLRGGLRQADEQDDHATVGDVGGDDPDNRRYSKPPLVSSSSTKSEKVGCSAKSASRKSDRISHGDRTSSSPPVGEERNVGDGAASAAATEVRAESSSPAVSRIFGMLSSLSSVGAWATRPISGRLSRASSTGSAGVRGADAGNSGGYGVGKSSRAYGGSGDGGSDQSKGAEESASYLSTAIGSKKGIDEAVGVGDAASPSKVHRQHKTARHDSDNFSSHSPRKNITGENHHPHQSVSSRSMGAGGGSAEVAGTWESDLKLALSMDLVNNGDGARGARSITRSDGIATDAMDGGSSSTGSNKRKPDASPACTPEGPSPTRGGRDYTPQHFGCAGVSTTDKGENSVREATSAAVARRLPVAAASGQGDKPREEIGSASGGTFRKGKAATTGTGLPSPGASWHTAHRRAAVEHVEAKETDDSSLVAATVQPASTTSDFAASDRWLSYRRSGSGVGAGSRRGQPHPRGDDGDCREPEGKKHGRKFDGDRTRSDVEKHITSDTVDLLANPWVKPSAIAAPHVVESSASVARAEAITSAARETESSARSESGTRHGGGKGDAHYARRRDHDVYEERTYDRVTGREFESALADTKFGSHSGNDGGGGSWRKLGGVEHGSHTVDGGYYSSTSGLKVAEAVLNDRLLGRRKGVAGAGSRDLSRGSSAQNGAVHAGSRRMVTSRYPFPHNTVAERAKNGGNESDEYHYKTLEELRRERRLRVQGLAGDASGVARGVSTALGHTSGCNGTSSGTRLDSASFERETMDRYDAYLDADDVLPDPAPSRQRHHQQQLPLQERRLRAGTAAQIVKSPRETSIATTAASTGARPPSPPRRSPDRNARAGECLLRWSNPKTARRAENIRAGASDVAGTKREPSPYRSERSALDIYRSRDYGALEAAGRRSSGYRSNSSTSVAGGTGSQDYEGARGKYRYGDIEREGGRTDALKRAESATWREDQQPGGGGGVSQKYVEMALGNSITTTATRSTYGHHRASSAAAASSNRVSLLSGGTPRRQEWKSGSLRRMLGGAGVAGKATGEHQEHHCSSPLLSGRLSSTESAAVRSASSGRSSSVSRSSVSAVPGAVARGFGGNGGTGGASTRTGLRGARAYEQQTLSSLRRSELLQHGAEGAAAGGDGFSRRRASMSSGGGAKSSFTGKFY